MKTNSIGINIKKYRLKRYMRQEDLAEKTNLSVNYISLLESGNKTPSLRAFIRIANALNITSDMILNEMLHASYAVRTSLLIDRIEKVSNQDKEWIYDVLETLIKNPRQIKP